jgi:hypothetical protein
MRSINTEMSREKDAFRKKKTQEKLKKKKV